MTTAKKYKVANPRDIPDGLCILHYTLGSVDEQWMEGDEFIRPAGMKAEVIDYWVEGGFLVEVTDG